MTLIRTLAPAALAALIASPALSLSCMAPDAARTYQQLDEAEERYIAVHGALSFDESKLPETDLQDQGSTPKSTPLPAQLTGMSLSAEGFTTPFVHPVTLDVRCYGPWCAGMTSGTEVLGFVELRESGPVLTLDPCYSVTIPEPDEKMLEQVIGCMKGEACAPMQ
ncbi:MAG: hypothetical protein RID23_18575 [Roseovarius sp.]